MNNVIELRDITVEFDGERVLDRLNLSIGDGEFVTLLGSSGCGKTTTLRVIAGFIQPQSGEVFFDGKSVAGLPPYKRPAADGAEQIQHGESADRDIFYIIQRRHTQRKEKCGIAHETC